MSDNLTKDRLDRAKCGGHDEYSPDCVVCTRRYYIQLIEGDYVPLHRFEQLHRQKVAVDAMLNSVLAELREATKARS